MTDALERDLLARLTDRWGKRVAVKKDELDLDGHFEPDFPDFPERLVPLLGLPAAGALDPEAKHAVLAASWVAYNAKTAAIENEIILPACRLMLDDHIPVRRDDAAVSALHQTIIDEHYHILMCHNAVGVTKRRRALGGLDFAPAGWAVVQGLESYLDGVSGASADLVRIAFALAAETTIGGFLSMLSTDHDIQPMNRITVDMHRKDESGHAVVFRELAGSLYRALDRDERELFKDALVAGLKAFRAPDFEPWVQVAAAGGVTVSAAELVTGDPGSGPPGRDTGPLQLLLADLGIEAELAGAVSATRGDGGLPC
jgi:hypothetical protein